MVYVSIDVETSGPIPGPHFMLSLGAVAFEEEGKEIASFGRNLLKLEGSEYDPQTREWWERN